MSRSWVSGLSSCVAMVETWVSHHLHDKEAGAGVDLHPSWWGMVVESCRHRNAKRCRKLGFGQSRVHSKWMCYFETKTDKDLHFPILNFANGRLASNPVSELALGQVNIRMDM